MEAFDSLLIIFGICGVLLGLYELFTKNVVGRKLTGVSKERIEKFSGYDAITYIVEGLMGLLLGMSEKIPFMQNNIIRIIVIVVVIAGLVFNGYFANQILGRQR